MNENTLKADEVVSYFVDCLLETGKSFTNELTQEELSTIEDQVHAYMDNRNIKKTDINFDFLNSFYTGSPAIGMIERYTPKNEFVAALQNHIGQRVTLYYICDLGINTVIQTTIEDVMSIKYAQHENSIHLMHKPKGKRSIVSQFILPYTNIVIYAGWVDVDVSSIYNVTETTHATYKQGKYKAFDKRNLTDVIDNMKLTPIIKRVGAY